MATLGLCFRNCRQGTNNRQGAPEVVLRVCGYWQVPPESLTYHRKDWWKSATLSDAMSREYAVGRPETQGDWVSELACADYLDAHHRWYCV